MQKLKLKNRLFAVLFALVVFCGAAGVARAASSSVQSDWDGINADASGTTGKDFEVGLQTPFAKPPSDPCEKDSYLTKMDTTSSGDKIYWVCAKGSIVWKQVIGGDDGQEILTNYAALIYKWLAGLIGVVAVLMIVAGGIEIATAGANQNGLQSGRDRIFAALIGLAILFSASLILYTINPLFFTNSVT